jgi:hypothetical protein
MGAPDTDRWRLRIDHTCDNAVLRDAALARLQQIKTGVGSSATIEHAFSGGVDIVRVVWLGQSMTVVVGFHDGFSLVGVQVPRTMAMFRGAVEKQVRLEVEKLVQSCGGSSPSITDVPISSR